MAFAAGFFDERSMTNPPDIAAIARGLTKAQRDCVMHCERDGNGAHVWAIYSLVKHRLMSLVPVPKLQGNKAYRLNNFGQQVRAYLLEHPND